MGRVNAVKLDSEGNVVGSAWVDSPGRFWVVADECVSSLRVDIEKCAGPLIVPEFDFTIRRGRFVEHRTVTIVIAAMGAWWLMTSVVTSVSRTPNNIAAGVGVAAVMAVVVVAYLIGAFAWSAARARRREAA